MLNTELILLILLACIAVGLVNLLYLLNRFYSFCTKEYSLFREYQAYRDYQGFYRSGLNTPLARIIEYAQREAGITLTWGAREMLIIPVIESLEAGGDVNWEQIEKSIRDLVMTIAEDRAPEYLPHGSRNSISMIRGFYKRFCNIPPFCSRKEG